jgi:uncharacterized membrane protein YeaQ/YmgE (transglycosylase-associated protein family)
MINLSFLWWFVAGPIAGWLTGRLMRSPGLGLMDALAGTVGGLVFGVAGEMLGLNTSDTGLAAVIAAAIGAIVVTFAFRKSVGKRMEDVSAPKHAGARSYTSYKDRMRK